MKIININMDYQSTRSNYTVSVAEAISRGISPDGGLFIPTKFPLISLQTIQNFAQKDYIQIALEILKPFFEGWPNGSLERCLHLAYDGQHFDNPIAPTIQIKDSLYALELWHGPTCAFKDMALQLLPSLLTESTNICRDTRQTIILTATSGDTGKAALAGFADHPNTQIIVFYPSEGVSAIQKLQMVTQCGNNVDVCAINGNFDDAQSAVKEIFTDQAFIKQLEQHNMTFSSANSINFGRLAPQIVYYFKSYADLITKGQICAGDMVNFAVPTGNFGNILAGYYAKQMGLPIAKLICASNSNNVLTDFIKTGRYDKNRDFHLTASPSMDILISSNLERLLAHMFGSQQTVLLMQQLTEQGSYTLSQSQHQQLSELFISGYQTDIQTYQVIEKAFNRDGYLADPHTAVAIGVAQQYRSQSGDNTPTIVLSTASPYKFAPTVLAALGADVSGEEFTLLKRLSDITHTSIPHCLASVFYKPVRFSEVYQKNQIKDKLSQKLGL